MILKFNVKEQTISLVNTKSVPRIGSKDYLVLQFSFSSDWENLDKLVYLQSGDVSQPINIVNNLVEVPEWFTEQDSFNVTLFGTDGTTEVPTNVVSVQLEKSNDLWVKDAPEPQPSWLVSVLDAAELVKEATVHGPTIGSNGNWYTWDFESKQYIDTGVVASGTTDHTKLTNRDADDQHPMSAITGLVGALDGKMDSNNPVGTGSFSMGRKSGTAVGYNSHAEGSYTTASGAVSHAEGYETTASGNESHAEGTSTTASGDNSHAEGYETAASGESSHAEGFRTVAMGSYSHAEGYDTTASGNRSHVQGKYNIHDNDGKYAHIVGNGVSHYERSNAHTLDWSGNAWYAGDVFVGSASGTNKDDGSKKLATEEYVNNEIADCIKAPATASVGQTIVVKAVDETGKPTEWEAVDMEASVDIDISRAPDLIIEVAEAVTTLSISEINGVPINTTEMVVLWEHPGGAKYIPAYFRFNNEVKNATDASATIANFNLPDNACPSSTTAAAILCRVKKINNGTYWYEFSGLQQNVGTITGVNPAVYGAPYRNNLIGETSIKEFYVYQASNIQKGCKVSVWVK